MIEFCFLLGSANNILRSIVEHTRAIIFHMFRVTCCVNTVPKLSVFIISDQIHFKLEIVPSQLIILLMKFTCIFPHLTQVCLTSVSTP